MPASFQANIHQKLKGKKSRHYRPLSWDLSVGFALCWRRAYASSPHVASEIGYPEKINRGHGPGRPSTVLDRTKGTPVVVLDSHWHGPPTSTSHLSIKPPPPPPLLTTMIYICVTGTAHLPRLVTCRPRPLPPLTTPLTTPVTTPVTTYYYDLYICVSGTAHLPRLVTCRSRPLPPSPLTTMIYIIMRHWHCPPTSTGYLSFTPSPPPHPRHPIPPYSATCSLLAVSGLWTDHYYFVSITQL